MTPHLENVVMAHRYRYYCLGDPLFSDFLYDQVERDARAVLPPESPVHGVGSSLGSSYSAEQIALANNPEWTGL